MRSFHNRVDEQRFLDEAWGSDEDELIILYGRRRTGKTELINEYVDDKPSLYFLCDEQPVQRNAERFAEQAAEHFEDIKPDVDGFDDVFDYIQRRKDQRIVIAVDEFSYLAGNDNTIPSMFQRIWDDVLDDAVLILCGSSISIMHDTALSYESPLYGRRTRQWELQPFTFQDAQHFYPHKSFEDRVRLYAVFGGIPAYAATIDAEASVEANIKDHILSKGSYLYDEPQFLLRQSLREPARYQAILEAIAHGHTKPSEIANDVGVNANNLPSYLNKLKSLRVIQRETPITAANQKRGVYTITDEFLRFYYDHVHPRRDSLEQNKAGNVLQTITDTIHHHVATTFETISHETLRADQDQDVGAVGRWWYNEHEVDIVATNNTANTLITGEAKWTNTPVTKALLDDLKTTTKQIRWKTNTRSEEYALFSKAGFTDDLKEHADNNDDIHLYDQERIQTLLQPVNHSES